MRTLLALVAALWFAYNAVSFAVPGTEEAAQAVVSAARASFIGLALLAFAFVEGSRIVQVHNAPSPPVIHEQEHHLLLGCWSEADRLPGRSATVCEIASWPSASIGA